MINERLLEGPRVLSRVVIVVNIVPVVVAAASFKPVSS